MSNAKGLVCGRSAALERSEGLKGWSASRRLLLALPLGLLSLELDWRAIGRRPVALGASIPRLLEIPTHIHQLLAVDLALADPVGDSLEEVVTSARLRVAERIGCAPCWDEILAQPDAVSELAQDWRIRA